MNENIIERALLNQLLDRGHEISDEVQEILNELEHTPWWRFIKAERLLQQAEQKNHECMLILKKLDEIGGSANGIK